MAWDVTSLFQLFSKTMANFNFVCAGGSLLTVHVHQKFDSLYALDSFNLLQVRHIRSSGC